MKQLTINPRVHLYWSGSCSRSISCTAHHLLSKGEAYWMMSSSFCSVQILTRTQYKLRTCAMHKIKLIKKVVQPKPDCLLQPWCPLLSRQCLWKALQNRTVQSVGVINYVSGVLTRFHTTQVFCLLTYFCFLCRWARSQGLTQANSI